MKTADFPALPLKEWKDTKQTLHLYTQIVGKIRLALNPFKNHWWHVPLYVNARGIGTDRLPNEDRYLEINFDFIDHRLKVLTSRGEQETFDLHNGLSVSEFYKKLFKILDQLDIKVSILAKPYDQAFDTPFSEDTEHTHYDKKYVERYWKILLKLDYLFREFNRDYLGKVCPIQLYWHSFDLAVTRFSGKKAPPMPEAGRVDQEAYSHEVISYGFWAGDDNIPDAALYSYTSPSPEGLEKESLKPEKAYWNIDSGSPMALLMYEDLRKTQNPNQAVLEFLKSAWVAGTKKANWDVNSLVR